MSTDPFACRKKRRQPRVPCASPAPRRRRANLGSFAVSRSCFGCSLSHLRTAAACLSRCIRHRRHSKANCARGAGFSACLQAEKTEGLYPRPGTAFTLHFRPGAKPAPLRPGAALGSPVQGELDFRLVYKPKRLRGCIPRQGIVFTPGLSAFRKKGKAKMCPVLRTKLPLRIARAGGFTFL